MSREEITEAKRTLYHALLVMPPEKLTPREVDIMFALSADADIQRLLQRGLELPKAHPC